MFRFGSKSEANVCAWCRRRIRVRVYRRRIIISACRLHGGLTGKGILFCDVTHSSIALS